MGKYFYNITQSMKFQRCNLNGKERMTPLKQLSSRSGGFQCQPCKVQYLQKNSHAFNYNKFSSQVKLCHLEDINIIYNLFASLFHRKFLLLANFPLFSGKKKELLLWIVSRWVSRASQTIKNDSRNFLDTFTSFLFTLNTYIFILTCFFFFV